MIGYIYLITDTTNGKQYVGQHHYDKEELDPNYHGSGTIITNIFSKRPSTLKEEYLKTCYSQEELDEWEKYFIFLYDTLKPNGYNLTEGGGGCVACEESKRKMSESAKRRPPNRKGKPMSEETRRKMSKVLKGRVAPNKGKPMSEEQKRKLSESKKLISEETRRKMSEAHKGKVSSMKGKHHSDETRRKLSEVRKGKPNIKLSKQLLQLTPNGDIVKEWQSTMECERNGFDRGLIRKCCKGVYKQYKGFVWKYKD